MKKRVLSVVIALIMMMSVFTVALAATNMTTPVGMDVSAMNTTDTNDNPYTGEIFSQYQLTVLNVWATWCGPCKSEMPHLQQFFDNYKELGVNLLGILVEDGNSTVAGANNYLAANGFTYPSLRMDSALRSLYMRGVAEANGIPMTFLADSKGQILSAKVGSFTSYSELENWVLEFWTNPVLEELALPKTASVDTNRMISLEPEFTPVYARIDSLAWTSSDEKVATVSEGGIVTGISEGKATITVTAVSDDVTLTAECEVTVKEAKIDENAEYYTLSEKVADSHAYAVVVEYNGAYYMMTPQQTVDGRYRLLGTKVAAEDMILLPTKDGETNVAFTKFDDKYLWYFAGDDKDGYNISNMSTGDYLSSIRANGVYRLSLKSKADTAFVFENGMLKTITKDHYTGSRQFISYYAEDANSFEAAFDLLESDSDLFTMVGLYETGSTVENTPEPTPEKKATGDVNGSGEPDAGDATMILRSVVGSGTLTEEQKKEADVNDNGIVDAGDATMVLRIVVGAA